jgi:TetR/AcrR family transcriptional regulator, mexCD-oprJ operon repressor
MCLNHERYYPVMRETGDVGQVAGISGRVGLAILESAARLVARDGEAASMADVAAAAGVARATVYRYFPNRRALLDDLAQMAIADVDARFRAARIDEVAPLEAVTRAVRTLVEGREYTALLIAARAGREPEGFERHVATPLRAALERAQRAKLIRSDIPSSWLAETLLGLVGSAFRASPPMGRDDMVATVTSLLLEGALETSAHVP